MFQIRFILNIHNQIEYSRRNDGKLKIQQITCWRLNDAECVKKTHRIQIEYPRFERYVRPMLCNTSTTFDSFGAEKIIFFSSPKMITCRMYFPFIRSFVCINLENSKSKLIFCQPHMDFCKCGKFAWMFPLTCKCILMSVFSPIHFHFN